jgi:hypothetical protein
MDPASAWPGGTESIADAVTEYVFQRESMLESRSATALNEQLGFLAHELRNHLHTATLATMAIKSGNVGMAGATGGLLDRSLIGMRNLIDRSLAGVRLTAGMPSRAQLISLADFIADVKISASLEAQTRECKFTVGDVDRTSDHGKTATSEPLPGRPSNRPWRIVLETILPNVLSVVAIVAIVDIGSVTLAGATLSFLGLGVAPPAPEWGAMVSDGITRPGLWWLTTFPGLALLTYVIGINLYGEVLESGSGSARRQKP